MEIGATLRNLREGRGWTQQQLADKLSVSVWTVRAYESGDKAPPSDIVDRAMQVFRAPELGFEYCDQCPANRLVAQLDCVDGHPVTQRLWLEEEAREAIEAANSLVLHKAKGPAAKAAAERAVEQLLDQIPAVQYLVATLCREFGLDLKTEQVKHRTKLRARAYRKKEAHAA